MNAWLTLASFILVCCCHDSLSCPDHCKCYHRRAEVVCNGSPITEFPSEGLPKNTTMLTIQFTNITSIAEHHLSAVPLLEGLHLFSNNLKNLSSHLLRGVPHLNTLDLTGNQLSHLPADVFSHAPLTSLVLKNNMFEEADGEWISDNSNLTWLDLSGNRLKSVPSSLLQKLPRMENLDLSHNRLEKIAPKSFDEMTHLERLNLHGNKLRELGPSIFRNNVNLTYLYLPGNQLKKIPPTLFQGLNKLQIVNLDDNQLSHIPPGLLDPLLSLLDDGLDLAGNPLSCDGKVEYLWRWLQKNNNKAFMSEIIVCASPPSLKGRSVFSLTESELELGS